MALHAFGHLGGLDWVGLVGLVGWVGVCGLGGLWSKAGVWGFGLSFVWVWVGRLRLLKSFG